jgi:hypothetical protein
MSFYKNDPPDKTMTVSEKLKKYFFVYQVPGLQ